MAAAQTVHYQDILTKTSLTLWSFSPAFFIFWIPHDPRENVSQINTFPNANLQFCHLALSNCNPFK